MSFRPGEYYNSTYSNHSISTSTMNDHTKRSLPSTTTTTNITLADAYLLLDLPYTVKPSAPLPIPASGSAITTLAATYTTAASAPTFIVTTTSSTPIDYANGRNSYVDGTALGTTTAPISHGLSLAYSLPGASTCSTSSMGASLQPQLYYGTSAPTDDEELMLAAQVLVRTQALRVPANTNRHNNESYSSSLTSSTASLGSSYGNNFSKGLNLNSSMPGYNAPIKAEQQQEHLSRFSYHYTNNHNHLSSYYGSSTGGYNQQSYHQSHGPMSSSLPTTSVPSLHWRKESFSSSTTTQPPTSFVWPSSSDADATGSKTAHTFATPSPTGPISMGRSKSNTSNTAKSRGFASKNKGKPKFATAKSGIKGGKGSNSMLIDSPQAEGSSHSFGNSSSPIMASSTASISVTAAKGQTARRKQRNPYDRDLSMGDGKPPPSHAVASASQKFNPGAPFDVDSLAEGHEVNSATPVAVKSTLSSLLKMSAQSHTKSDQLSLGPDTAGYALNNGSPYLADGMDTDQSMVLDTSISTQASTIKQAPAISTAKSKSKPVNASSQNRVCNYCQATTTPMWRHGPPGYPDLCNKCGVKWMRRRILQDDVIMS
ncbi:hypothetical protein BATDEDRAFT_85119 [Batrachochytrium dendrobatidis JAM81]|uniref:GATA-type domain-containing protein n=1 Tax=Batrachochytrium dendrobatidis (strain JAM81 / FGSC 10211) TaxID=684364 RepID=F4NUG3_BATDJ|nr:uncharacterized protein BATDEDRAFT_85119 [Batrachochytrium dendrobatidis JAM81]EGF84406.1 hypothetical protein BATDEDRAFT_85119 [Batrachochytrium dendrobatidis JAM81]|eukprot:XP_006676428.1 hypothetical protein BATDEDRAFT_85119 [Batrachochytrium dendrobatidis JAM81]